MVAYFCRFSCVYQGTKNMWACITNQKCLPNFPEILEFLFTLVFIHKTPFPLPLHRYHPRSSLEAMLTRLELYCCKWCLQFFVFCFFPITRMKTKDWLWLETADYEMIRKSMDQKPSQIPCWRPGQNSSLETSASSDASCHMRLSVLLKLPGASSEYLPTKVFLPLCLFFYPLLYIS